VTEKFDPEAHAEAMAKAMGLTIRPEWRPTVVANVKATAEVAGLVMSFPLDDTIEPATVFEP
jgi:hypothetical protein